MADASVHRVLLLGAAKTGKSALAIRFVHGYFIKDYDPTVEDAYRKRVALDNDHEVLLELFKLPQGEYEPTRIGSSTVRNAAGVVAIFSVQSKASFDELSQLLDSIISARDGARTIVLCGTMNDCAADEREVPLSEAKALADRKDIAYCECSPQSGDGVENVFQTLLTHIRKPTKAAQDTVGSNGGAATAKKGCCMLL